MDCPYINFMAIYIISASLLGTNSGRGVTHWKINEQGSSIVQGNESDRNYVKTDPVFALLIEHYPPKIVPAGKLKTGKNKSGKKAVGERGLRCVFTTEIRMFTALFGQTSLVNNYKYSTAGFEAAKLCNSHCNDNPFLSKVFVLKANTIYFQFCRLFAATSYFTIRALLN